MNPTIQNVKKILVIGAGQMGSQIGLTAALAGYDTAVTDIAPELLCRARAHLSAWLEDSVQAGRLTKERSAAALDRMQFSSNLEAVASEADFVVEAATERLDVKRRIFERLGELAPAHAVLTTNSSTLGSSKVALASGRPDRVCNMHFFNPALVMKCVEVVRHDGTSQAIRSPGCAHCAHPKIRTFCALQTTTASPTEGTRFVFALARVRQTYGLAPSHVPGEASRPEGTTPDWHIRPTMKNVMWRHLLRPSHELLGKHPHD